MRNHFNHFTLKTLTENIKGCNPRVSHFGIHEIFHNCLIEIFDFLKRLIFPTNLHFSKQNRWKIFAAIEMFIIRKMVNKNTWENSAKPKMDFLGLDFLGGHGPMRLTVYIPF